MESEPWNVHWQNQPSSFYNRKPKNEQNHPAFVTWYEANEFCDALTKSERRAGRIDQTWKYALPTEAQWEYACGASRASKFFFGDDASSIGQFVWRYEDDIHPIAQKKPNPWNLFDTYGNAAEWCRDFYEEGKLPGGSDPFVSLSKSGDSKRVQKGYNQNATRVRCGVEADGVQGFRVCLVSSED